MFPTAGKIRKNFIQNIELLSSYAIFCYEIDLKVENILKYIKKNVNEDEGWLGYSGIPSGAPEIKVYCDT